MKKSMNIHRKYVPNWSSWEIARELISNAIDACGDDYVLESSDGNNLRIKTSTHPTMSQMLHVGSGSKSHDSNEIGIFGEGFKLAVLVATRMGSLTCTGKEGTMTFSFEEEFGEEVLHVNLDTRKKTKEFVIDVQVPGVGADIHSKILKNRKAICLPKFKASSTRIYHKGIWITDLEDTNSLWDWNLSKLDINRDRNMVSVAQITPHIRDFMHDSATQDMWEEIYRSLKPAAMMEVMGIPGLQKQGKYDITPAVKEYTLEADAVFTDSCRFIAENPIEAYDAFFAVYGKKAVVCDKFNIKEATAVIEKGYEPVFGPHSFDLCGSRLGLPMSKDILENKNEYRSAELDYEYQASLDKMQKFLRRFNIRHRIIPCILAEYGKELTYDEADSAGLEVDRVMFEDNKIMVPYFDSRSMSDMFSLVFKASDYYRTFTSSAMLSQDIAGQLAAETMEGEYNRGF